MAADWNAVPEAVRIGRRAFRTIKQNLRFTAGYNVVGIALAARLATSNCRSGRAVVARRRRHAEFLASFPLSRNVRRDRCVDALKNVILCFFAWRRESILSGVCLRLAFPYIGGI
jgi:hypothetical protein